VSCTFRIPSLALCAHALLFAFAGASSIISLKICKSIQTFIGEPDSWAQWQVLEENVKQF
jgi:hypothetical protein